MGVYATQRNKIRAIVMDFLEAFDTLEHNLLCKIKTYGLDKNALTLIQSNFSNRHQIIIKIDDKFSKWKKSQQACHKFLFLVIYFSTLFINDLFYFFLLKLIHYADCNAMYSSNKNANIVINRLRHNFFEKTTWLLAQISAST